MYWNNYMFTPMMWGGAGRLLGWVIPFALLDLVLKAFALWRSAKRGEQWWFIALLLINSLGILPGLYLLSHPEPKKKKQK